MDWPKFLNKAAKKVLFKTGATKTTLKTIQAGTYSPLRAYEVEAARKGVMSMLYLCIPLYMGIPKDKFNTLALKKASQFVIDSFPWVSVPEIDQAFSLAASGVLEVDLAAYHGVFSIKTIGDLLRSYKVYRAKILAEVESEIREQKEKERKEQLAKEKNSAARLEFCKEVQTWLDMAKEGITYFETWKDIPFRKVEIAAEEGLIIIPEAKKEEIEETALEEAKNALLREKYIEVTSGRASSKQYDYLKELLDMGGQPEDLKAKQKIIFYQLALWELIKPAEDEK